VAIVAADIKFKLSVNTSPGNANAQGNVNNSLGGYMASTEITDATLNNLFDDVTGDENSASDVEYRGMFVHNDHATIDWTSVVMWISSEVGGGTTVAIAPADEGAVPEDQAGTVQMETIADEQTAPSGPSFSAPTTKGTGISLGTIGANEAHGIWVRRTAADTAAVNNDGFTLSVEGDTTA
jgi:hypothetical protein